MADKKVDRNVLIGLLTKMGVERPQGLNTERMIKKLQRRLESKGIPENLSDAEKAVIAEFAGPIPPPVDEAKEDVTKEKPAVAEKPALAAPVEVKKTKPVGGKSRDTGTVAAFKNAFKSRKQYERKELHEVVFRANGGGGPEDARHSANTTNNYIALAKKEANPYGFVLTEKKTAEGKRILTRVG